MSASHLPDDPADWPADPFAVLGVRRGADAKELRRAYTALIRVFKPEHHPDHFRRIREAFEFAQRYSAFFQPAIDPEPSRSEEQAPAAAEPSAPMPPLVTPEPLWDRAVRGETGEAYHGLRAELDRGPPRAELYARLYWLASASPEVDPDRPPVEWLTRGLVETGFSGMLIELYRGELLNNPAEAGSPRSARLLAADGPADGVATATRLRWQALARLGRWSAIADEFDPARERLRAAGEPAWLSLVVDARSWVAFGRHDLPAADLAKVARQEIRSLEHLALRQGGLFDQVEWVEVVGRSCEPLRKMGHRGTDLVAVLRDSWLLPTELIRRPLETLLGSISGDPVGWVEFLDRAAPEVFAALNQFGNLLDRYQADAGIEAESPHPAEVVRKLARDVLMGSAGQFRALALRLCLDNAIDPGIIRAAFHPHNGGPDVLPGWVAELAGDAPLHYVCWACRLFRA